MSGRKFSPTSALSVLPVPSTSSRNCCPYVSRGSSWRKRCRNDTWLGSMPPSTPWSQLHSHSPLKANVYSSGAVKQS